MSSWPLKMPSNAAAWLTAAKANPFEVKSEPYTSASENDIVIKSGAVAINPFDWMIQHMGDALFPLPYPSILGFDVAGEVVEVGSSGSRFTIGDRVRGATKRPRVLFRHTLSSYPIWYGRFRAIYP